MELPPFSEGVPGQAPGPPVVLTVDWRRRMEFDGLTARFESVVATTTQHEELETEVMKVWLQRPIRFADADVGEPPVVERIECLGGVMMKRRTFDEQQQPVSFEQMQLTDLSINRLNGELNGGPGWINSVHYGSADMLESPLATGGKAPAKAASPQVQLKCLHVWFHKSIQGNLWRRHLTFNDNVRAAYAPVNNWDAMLTTANQAQLGPEGVGIKCDELQVGQQFALPGNRQPIWLKALGNAKVDGSRVDGTTYTACGNRITYEQGKELLTLEGDGPLSNAELWRELQVGAEREHTAAQKILYWRKTNNVSLEGVQSLQMGQFPRANAK